MKYDEIKVCFQPFNFIATGFEQNDIVEYEKNISKYDQWLKTLIIKEKKVNIFEISIKRSRILIEAEFKNGILYLLARGKEILCSLQMNKEKKLITIKEEERLMKMLHKIYKDSAQKVFLAAQISSEIKMISIRLAFHFLSKYDADVNIVKESTKKENENSNKTIKMQYNEIIYQNIDTGLISLMDKNNYTEYLSQKEEVEKLWKKLLFEKEKVLVDKYEGVSVDFQENTLRIYLKIKDTTETFTILLKKEKNLRLNDVTGNALFQLNYDSASPLFMMLIVTGKIEILKEITNLAICMGIHYFCQYGGDVNNIITADIAKKHNEEYVQLLQEKTELKKQLIEEKRKNKKNEKKDTYLTPKIIYKNDEKMPENISVIQEKENLIKKLQEELDQANKIIEIKNKDLEEKEENISKLEMSIIEHAAYIDDREKTISSQKRQIQELNKKKKFELKEASNVSAEQIRLTMSLEKDNNYLKKELYEAKKEIKRLSNIIKEIELQY